MCYLWGAEGGIGFLFKAHGPEAGERKGTDWSKEAFEGSAQLQDGAGTEIGPATALEGVTRPIQMLSRLRALFSCVGMFGAEILGDAGQRKWVTWNYVTNFRQLLHPCQPKQHRPRFADCQMSPLVFGLALNSPRCCFFSCRGGEGQG